MSNTPSDAELNAILRAHWPAETNDWASHIDFARAVLEKWGQPAQAAEPVAWLRNTTDPQPHAVTNLKYRSAVDAKAGVEYIPVFAAPQPVAREPLTDEQIKDGHTGMPRDVWAFADGVRFAEQHHGIKGGQHGTE